jgi:hypothetical protein
MTVFQLDGVVDDRKAEAEQELAETIGFFFPNENPIQSIIVTCAFGEKISEITCTSFNPQHDYGRCAAKTIPTVKEGKLTFVIILDAALFGKWRDEEKIWRKCILMHELNHVDYQDFVFSKIGDTFFKQPKGYTEAVLSTADSVWQEYDSSRFVMWYLHELADKLKGEVNDPFSAGNAEQLFDTVNGMAAFSIQCIEDYRKGILSLDKLQYSIIYRIEQALILWAYTFPAIGIVNEVTEIYVEIQKLGDYKLMQSNLQEIQLILEQLYDKRKEYLPELIDRIAEQIDLLIGKFGLKCSDLSDGRMYIGITDIKQNPG